MPEANSGRRDGPPLDAGSHARNTPEVRIAIGCLLLAGCAGSGVINEGATSTAAATSAASASASTGSAPTAAANGGAGSSTGTSAASTSGGSTTGSVSGSTSETSTGRAIPGPAADAGYLDHTFAGTFSAATVDVGRTGAAGFAFYPWTWFGQHMNTSELQLNDDGSITLLGTTTASAELATAIPAANSAKFVGTAFGGGAYFEAALAFNPQQVIDAGFVGGWPAFWSLAIDADIGLPTGFWYDTNPDAGYLHNIENDFFEYDQKAPATQGQTNVYGSVLHDWYGVYGKTCPPNLCVANPTTSGLRTVPVGTDFTTPHRFGALWQPATATHLGSASYYFDGQLLGNSFEWQPYGTEGVPGPTPVSPWQFSWMDRGHYFVILGTRPGEPMRVLSVDVWQANSAANLRQ